MKPPNSPPTRFKGVVLLRSGRWGAYIYVNYQRSWLGTFKSEREAALAYDSAAINLCSGKSHRNFPWSPVSVQEPVFQKHYTTDDVLSMIKDGSYSTKFSDFLEHQQRLQLADQDDHEDNNNNNNGINDAALMMSCENNNMTMTKRKMRVNWMEKFNCRKLFQKELTPSDVGKPNRLVIPKCALEFFPGIMSADADQGQGMVKDKDVLLSFYDPLIRLWKFRYCYWKSSKRFVFSKGWNRFVKEKELKAKDVITVFMCEGHQATESENSEAKPSSFYLIDVSYFDAQSNEDNYIKKEDDEDQENVVVNTQENIYSKTSSESSQVAENKEAEQSSNKKIFLRLFGVDIPTP